MKANEIEEIVWGNKEMKSIYTRVLSKLYYANFKSLKCHLAEVIDQTISNRFDEIETDGMVLKADIDEYQYNSTEEAAYYFARSVYANGGTSDDIVLDY